MSGCHFHLQEIAEALAETCGAQLRGSDGAFDGVGTDTRTLKPGQLFIALQGPNFDGHDYIASAAARGAVAVIVAHAVKTELPQIVVSDTLAALGELAALWRSRTDIPVIVITGSNGKTTVKEMLAAILGQSQNVLATQGNLNNEIGLPLTLLRLDESHRAAVIEAGASKPGDIAYLTRIAAPTVAVLNNASGAHLAGFGSLESVASSKGEIFAGLTENGTAVINADDAFAAQWLGMASAHAVLTFALDAVADVRGVWADGEPLQIDTPQGKITVQLPLPGRHNAMNALAATAAALAADVSLADIRAGLESLRPVPGRLCWKTARNGARILDDSYNANPASLRAALDVLAGVAVGVAGERYLALGDMAELGGEAEALHASAGRRAHAAGVTRLYAVGDLSRHAVAAFSALSGGQAWHFPAQTALIERLQQDLQADSTLLVKGSRSAHMEHVVAALTEEVV